MPAALPPLRGFKTFCTVVAAAYVLLGGSMLVRGARDAMGQFGVPEAVLASPHFADFFHWVFVHMTVLGLLIGMLGRLVTDGRHQHFVACALFLIALNYTYLDLRTSDSPFGNRLYRGAASLVPPLIDVVVCAGFLYFALSGLRRPPAARSS